MASSAPGSRGEDVRIARRAVVDRQRVEGLHDEVVAFLHEGQPAQVQAVAAGLHDDRVAHDDGLLQEGVGCVR